MQPLLFVIKKGYGSYLVVSDVFTTSFHASLSCPANILINELNVR